ncbi:MAG: helix-turn-helix transcriptional regulator [Acidimicrobiia bacterium]
MAKTLEEMLAERPVNREAVDRHKKRMIDEMRSYKLRELREAVEMTQVQLAERLDISQNRVSRIEHGDIERTQVDTLRKYAEAIGGHLKVEVVFGDDTVQIA